MAVRIIILLKRMKISLWLCFSLFIIIVMSESVSSIFMERLFIVLLIGLDIISDSSFLSNFFAFFLSFRRSSLSRGFLGSF